MSFKKKLNTYRPEIDGLRALAILPVLFFHAGFESFSGGFIGVDIFFVISGYLITSIIINEMANEEFNIFNFYERRARRILPALFFVILVCIPIFWLWLSPNDLKNFGQSVMGVITFTSNIFFWQVSGDYFHNSAELTPLLHTWSLALEEQFYIFFPLILIIFSKLNNKWLSPLLFILFLISLVLAQWGSVYEPFANFFLLPTRAWELILGAMTAYYLIKDCHFKSIKKNQVLSIVGFSMIIYSIFTFDRFTPTPSYFTLIPTLGTVFLICSTLQNSILTRLLSLKPLVFIGLISYSTYLWHQPLLVIFKYRFQSEPGVLTLSTLCLLAIFLGYFSWFFIERPFRDKTIILTRKFIQLALFISLFLFTFGFLAYKTNGFFEQKLKYHNIELPPYQEIDFSQSKCWDQDSIDEICKIGNGKKNLVFLGDSHLISLIDLFLESEQSDHFQVHPLLAGECFPILGHKKLNSNYSEQKSCSQELQLQRLEYIKSLENESIVVIGGRLPLVLSNGEMWNNERDEYRQLMKDNDWDLNITNSIRKYINIILEEDIKVVLVYPIPELGIDPIKVMFSNLTSYNNILNYKIDAYFERASDSFELLDSFHHKNIFRIYPHEFVCQTGFDENSICSPFIDGQLIYKDDDHLNQIGANLLLEKLLLFLKFKGDE